MKSAPNASAPMQLIFHSGSRVWQDIINSTELRAASSTPFDNGLHFTMAPVVEQRIEPAFKPAAPDVRRSGRLAAVVELAPDPPPADDTVFVVPASVDQEIRRGCWLGGRYM